MARRILPLEARGDVSLAALPDQVPQRFKESTPNFNATPLVFYIWRIPSSRDCFLTLHKLPNQGPTDMDVIDAKYILHFCDDHSEDNEALPLSSGLDPLEWRNDSQTSLVQRGLLDQHCTRMQLMAVDSAREDYRVVATMVDLNIRRSFRLPRNRGLSSDSSLSVHDPRFIDMFNEAYRPFGFDVGYFGSKAFTRRMFTKIDPQHPGHPVTLLSSPWQGKLIMTSSTSRSSSVQTWHRLATNEAAGPQDVLMAELRPNFSNTASSHVTRASWSTTYETGETIRKRARRLSILNEKSLGGVEDRTNRKENVRGPPPLPPRPPSQSTKPPLPPRPLSGPNPLSLRTSRGDQTIDSPTNEAGPDVNLEIAQEPLGGGKGKDAKLGKLIIQQSGFGCLDLLVAANLVEFNRAYSPALERVLGCDDSGY